MTPVFDRDKKILGYLDYVPYKGSSFKLQARQRLSAFPTKEPEPTVTLRECWFEWARIGSRRPGADGHYCDVLIASDPDVLNDILGFEWFAEVHGKPVEVKRQA